MESGIRKDHFIVLSLQWLSRVPLLVLTTNCENNLSAVNPADNGITLGMSFIDRCYEWYV